MSRDPDVLDDDEPRPDLRDDGREVPPERASFAADAAPLAGAADVLTREPSADNVHMGIVSRAGRCFGFPMSVTPCTCSATTRRPWGLPPETLAPPTVVSESSLLPTPTAPSGYQRGGAAGRAGPVQTMARTGLWPTPVSTDADRSYSPSQLKRKSIGLRAAVAAVARMWPTPVRRDDRGMRGGGLKRRGGALPNAVGGPLNPRWVEWLMGFPVGWTEGVDVPRSEPSETRSSRRARKSRAK